MGFDMNAFSQGKKPLLQVAQKRPACVMVWLSHFMTPVQRLSFWTQIHRLKTRWQNWVAPNLDTTPW